MAFKEVTGESKNKKETTFYPYKGMETGFEVEGFLKHKHTKQATTRAGKPAFKEDGTPKMQSFYFIDMPEWEKSKGLYGCGKLDFLMNKVEVGNYIKFTYLGKEKVEGFVEALHQMRLEVDEDRINDLLDDAADAPAPDDEDLPF